MKAMSHAVGTKRTSEVSFSADWLALRAPADLKARDHDMLVRAAACAPPGTTVLDLGSGTGATAQAFTAAGFGGIRWHFFDNDPVLLAIAGQNTPGAECITGDLAQVNALPLDGLALVTASALLDLMPRTWVEALAARLRAAGLPFYAALNYDGAMNWIPAGANDADVTASFNRHQVGDKGIGAALGPASGVQAAEIFRAAGFEVTLARSPWKIGPDQAPLHRALLIGIGQAAGEAGCEAAEGWTTERCAAVRHAQAIIGHTDLLALPRRSRS